MGRVDRKRDKRQQILKAAVRVFAETGFHRSRVSDIARAAKVADGTIYLYFKSKDDILISIFEEAMEEMITAAKQVISETEGPLDQLRALAALHMRNVEERRYTSKVLQVELRLSSTFMKEYEPVRLKEYMNVLGQVIEEGQRRGVIRAGVNPVIVRRALFGALDEIAMQWALTRQPNYGLAESAREIADVFVRGLQVEGQSD